MSNPPLLAALGTLLLVAVAAVAVSGGAGTLALAVLLAQACLAIAWAPALAVPGARGVAALGLGTGALAAGALAIGEREEVLTPLGALLGMAVLAGFCLQLVRRDGRTEVVASLTAALSAAIITGLGALLVAATKTPGGRGVVLSSLVGIGAAGAVVAVASLTRRRWARTGRGGDSARATTVIAGSALVAGTLGGVLLGAVAADEVTGRTGGAIGAAAALVAVTAAQLPGWVPVAGDLSARIAVGAALPVLAAGPVAYVLGRVLVG